MDSSLHQRDGNGVETGTDAGFRPQAISHQNREGPLVPSPPAGLSSQAFENKGSDERDGRWLRRLGLEDLETRKDIARITTKRQKLERRRKALPFDPTSLSADRLVLPIDPLDQGPDSFSTIGRQPADPPAVLVPRRQGYDKFPHHQRESTLPRGTFGPRGDDLPSITPSQANTVDPMAPHDAAS